MKTEKIKMKVLSFTDRGAELAERVCKIPQFSSTHERCGGGRFKEIVRTAFFESDAILFIGAAGIAVRAIAPHVQSKLTDPAVLVSDELGRFIIPILSGHVGGANELAKTLAEYLGMTPVITTATDINGMLSIDTWATEHHLTIENAPKIKDVSMKVLRGKKIRVLSEISLADIPSEFESHDGLHSGVPDVYIGPRPQHFMKEGSLCLTPKILHVGIGCRRGTPESAISALFEEVFTLHHLSRNAVAGIASIDLKADEEGLIDFCKNSGLPLRFFGSDELLKLCGRYEFSSSSFVRDITGVDSVCERAAVKSAEAEISASEEESVSEESSKFEEEASSGFGKSASAESADLFGHPGEALFPARQCPDSRERVRILQKKIAKNGVTLAIAVVI